MSQKIAALIGELSSQSPSGRIQLLPDGCFRTAADGRPNDVPHWILDKTNGFAVASQANATENELVIDYEHQTINTAENGRPAPAAGWIKHVEYIPGKGLFADVEWTDNAASMIAAREYRYVSAVFTYDNNGYVLRLLHAAITNFPALDGLNELLVACSQFFTTQKDASNMNEIIKLLRQAFKMPDATEQQLQTALTELVKTQPADVALSAAFTKLAEQNNKIVALSAQLNNPDPAKLVSVETMQELQKQVVALTAQLNTNQASQVIENALANGQLLPAQKQWATDLAATPDGLAKLTAYLDTMPAIAALSGKSGQQSAANAGTEKVAALTENEKAAAKALGYSEAEYRDLMKEEGK